MTQDIIKVRTIKGSHPRKGINWQKYSENYERIFGKKEGKNDAQPTQPEGPQHTGMPSSR